jgi:hypothetical protein
MSSQRKAGASSTLARTTASRPVEERVRSRLGILTPRRAGARSRSGESALGLYDQVELARVSVATLVETFELDTVSGEGTNRFVDSVFTLATSATSQAFTHNSFPQNRPDAVDAGAWSNRQTSWRTLRDPLWDCILTPAQ